jgi:AraC-like DNA-binding protein
VEVDTVNPKGDASWLVARDVLAQPIDPALHVQRWSLDGRDASALSRAIHLQSGHGVLADVEGELPLRAGDVVWLPAGAARWLRVEAGSTGIVVGVSDLLLALAIGQRADATNLRQVSQRRCVITAPEPGPREELLHSLRAIQVESKRGAQASCSYLAAHLALVLIMLWRLTTSERDEPQALGPGAQRLLRFRHLVEAQFRAHWPVWRYADELGVSTDRLHELCAQRLGRSPLQLVHQRLVREACSLLVETDLPVARIASELGFGTVSSFSRFFKRWQGHGPQAWRVEARRHRLAGKVAQPSSYADWP